jgi:hypothetical protein
MAWDWTAFANTVAGALIGTAIGALVAFWIDDRKERDHQRREEAREQRRLQDEYVAATNNAIYALVRVANDLGGYRQQILEKLRNDPDRWYLLRPTPLPVPVPLDTATLAFLFEMDGDAPNLPMKVHLGLECYASIYELAQMRNDVHNKEAQPAIERSQRRPTHGRGLEQQLHAETGGPRVYMTLKNLTNDLYSMVDATLASISVTAQELRSVVKGLYPDRQVIQFRLLDVAGPETRPPP